MGELRLQDFTCEKCGKDGRVPFLDDEGVGAVHDRIGDEHALLSPECQADWGMAYVRIHIGGSS